MNCLVCHEPRELVGGACTECLDAIRPKIAVTPEQVALRSNGASSMTSLLLDPWGRVRPLERRTVIGRALEGPGLLILDTTVSRRHAAIELRDNAWYVEDFESANGTYVEGQRIHGRTPLRDGERVRFGDVSFFFLDPVAAPPDIDTSSLQGFTVRSPPMSTGGATAGTDGTSAGATGPSRITIDLREPSGGGGGIAVIDGKHVGLTLPQFELVALLYDRARVDASAFVHVNELAKTLSLDSAEPNEDNVRQLVRRLRRLLFKAGINGLIESRYGQGYRLALARS